MRTDIAEALAAPLRPSRVWNRRKRSRHVVPRNGDSVCSPQRHHVLQRISKRPQPRLGALARCSVPRVLPLQPTLSKTSSAVVEKSR